MAQPPPRTPRPRTPRPSTRAVRWTVRECGGVLINNASVDSAASFPYFSAYVASRWAVRGFATALRQEYGETGVAVCTVLPAVIDTPLFHHAGNYTGRAMKALNPVYAPEMVASAMLRCAERRPREVIVGGAGKLMALHYALAPGLAERLFAAQVETDHFRSDVPAPSGPGNLFAPMSEGTGVHGGWGGSRTPDVIAGGAAAGLAVLAASITWLSSRRLREAVRRALPAGRRRRLGIVPR